MTAGTPSNPFIGEPGTAETHFKLYYYAAILHVIDRLVQMSETPETPFERFPFLVGYVNELARIGLEGVATSQAHTWWRERLFDWEADINNFLPIRALREAADLSYETLVAFFCIGLAEEDPRFGALFEAVQSTPGQRCPTYGLLNVWNTDLVEDPSTPPQLRARAIFRQLEAAHLVRVTNPDVLLVDWTLQPDPLIWEIVSGRGVAELRGDGDRTGSIRDRLVYRPPDKLLHLDQLIVTPELREQVGRLPQLLASGEVQTLVIRGAQRNGRRTLLGAVAAELGRGLLEVPSQSAIRPGPRTSQSDCALAGPVATLLNAMPVVAYELAPGETADRPRLDAYAGPLGVVVGRHGGLRDAGQVLTLYVDMPSPRERMNHWRRAVLDQDQNAMAANDLDVVVRRFRLTSGAIYRAADLAHAWKALRTKDASDHVTLDDVRHATRTLNRQALDTLAQPVAAAGCWNDLATRDSTVEELMLLESRCRHREQLATIGTPALDPHAEGGANHGVRALFSGPSGTGKTLAARILASVLNMDLYRVDLSSVVNKYIGETEKNLNELLTRAEELDVLLLIDEGDSLLTQRTSVQTSNDRYANLETNFLLQRLESYQGIVVITTNAGDRIDSAFQRRMDVVIEFRPPDPRERLDIWQLHLPSNHRVDGQLLLQLAERCPLNGGQIRNAVLHASVLALENGGCITSQYLENAVRREYRKTGSMYPIKVQYG